MPPCHDSAPESKYSNFENSDTRAECAGKIGSSSKAIAAKSVRVEAPDERVTGSPR